MGGFLTLDKAEWRIREEEEEGVDPDLNLDIEYYSSSGSVVKTKQSPIQSSKKCCPNRSTTVPSSSGPLVLDPLMLATATVESSRKSQAGWDFPTPFKKHHRLKRRHRTACTSHGSQPLHTAPVTPG